MRGPTPDRVGPLVINPKGNHEFRIREEHLARWAVDDRARHPGLGGRGDRHGLQDRAQCDGALCGYVAVPPGHPAHGKDYDDVGVTVHGGLTYARPCQEGGEVCHVPRPGYPDDVWWLGFDCSHYCDYCPGMDRHGETDQRRYKTIAYVQTECAELAQQLKAMVP